MKIGEIISIEDCGHAKAQHILVDDKEMKSRLIYGDVLFEGKIREVKSDISTRFLNEALALKAIARTLEKHKDIIAQWLDFRTERRLVLRNTYLKPIGYGYAKNTNFNTKYDMYSCVVILQLGYNGSNFDIVTAYPDTNVAVQNQIKQDRFMYINNKRKK